MNELGNDMNELGNEMMAPMENSLAYQSQSRVESDSFVHDAFESQVHANMENLDSMRESFGSLRQSF